jgi:8-oxo-dGTP pyrophosphatase MutT (NUDIX family)
MAYYPPPTGVEAQLAEVAAPRPAGSVLLLRDGADDLEVLLIQRASTTRLMAGIWAYPGGTVDPGESGAPDPWAAAAARELAEETGVVVAVEDLVPHGHWITPPEVRRRYDTKFFLASAPPGAQVTLNAAEHDAARWVAPRAALAEHDAGALWMVLPTIENLRGLTTDRSIAAALQRARRTPVVTVIPEVPADFHRIHGPAGGAR